LLNPPKLLSFLNAVTSSVSTDKKLSKLTKLYDLANQFKDIGLSKIQFLTMPITTYQPDPNRLAAGEGADELWRTLRLDKPLTKEQKSGAVKASQPSEGTTASKSPTATPAAADAEQNGLCA